MSLGQQALDQVRADEARAAGYQDILVTHGKSRKQKAENGKGILTTDRTDGTDTEISALFPLSCHRDIRGNY